MTDAKQISSELNAVNDTETGKGGGQLCIISNRLAQKHRLQTQPYLLYSLKQKAFP